VTIGSEWLDSHAVEPRLQLKRATTVAGIALLLFGAGLALGLNLSPVESDVPAATRPSSGPVKLLNDVPVGYARTEGGAAAAAENFLRIGSGSLVTDEHRYVRAMSTMAAPEWKPRAETTGRNAVSFFRDYYGPEGALFTAPVAVEVVDFTGNRARVEMWSVSIATGSKRPRGEQVWGITTLDLRWVAGDWRISHVRTESSLAPALMGGQRPGPVEKIIEEFDPGA